MESPHQATAEELLFRGDEKEAMVFYSRLMVEQPDREDLWLIQILYLIGQKQWTEAEAWISRALAQFPAGGPEFLALRQAILATQGRAEEAWGRLGKLESEHEGNWLVLLCGAIVLSKIRGRTQRSAACLKSALAAMPRENLVMMLLTGGMAEACENLTVAAELFNRAADLNNDCAYAMYRAAVALAALERIKEARKMLLGADFLAAENVRLRKKIAQVKPRTRWERFLFEIFGED